MLFLRYGLIIFSLLIFSCSSLYKRNTLTLENVKKFKVEQTTPQQIKDILGSPDETYVFDDEITWIYLKDRGYGTKVSFTFDNNTKKLLSFGWFAQAGDPEINLDIAKNRFPKAKFERIEREWVNPHAAPDEVDFVDKKLGISIAFRKTRKEVRSVVWHTTNLQYQKKPASTEPKIKYEI